MDRITSALLPTLTAKGTGSFQLKDGQLVIGKISELYPNQRALIQIGANKALAVVEAPLIKGAEYLFEAAVLSKTGVPKLRLREQLDTSGNMDRLTAVINRSLGLPSAGKEHSQLAERLLRANIPFSADELPEAAEWLKSVPESLKADGFKTVTAAFERGLPITGNTLSALFEALTGGTLKNDLQLLASELAGQDLHKEKPKALRQVIEAILAAPVQRKASLMMDQLIQWNDEPLSADHVNASGILKKLNTAPNPEEMLRTIFTGGVDQETLLSSEESSWLVNKGKEIEVLAQPKELVRLFSMLEKSLTMIQDHSKDALLKDAAFRSLLADAADLEGAAGESAEKLSRKLNGIQLSQTEQPGVTTIWHHFPIQDERILSDVSIQFQLRKDSEGKIDPAFCKLVFYLELANLGSIMADVQIQNRIVTAVVHSKHDLGPLAAGAAAELKAQFQNLPYQFSGISFKRTEKSKVPEPDLYQTPKKGFDFKI
ncbi:GTPase-associated protein 1-related protein [Bacillus sp. SJS]|uniref:GTPase-associated protein 1-related protein n=1 Tax=Bacillus sp. SJS TaxID=1423321 RepID=UPI0004DCFA35|nr:GTPase-associated protein 1-related protein [Bacillus sp. SJS]KZZ82865.1 hypothetical protein AS29_018865 [Bacillus sp. SJS]